jgi:hypothetical protein
MALRIGKPLPSLEKCKRWWYFSLPTGIAQRKNNYYKPFQKVLEKVV